MIGESGLDFAMLKGVVPSEKELLKQAQKATLSVFASTGLPMSLHCVRADHDMRSCLGSSFQSCTTTPPFIVLHGYSFKDVGAWLSWERKLKADVRVMFGVCSRHVSSKIDFQSLLASNPALKTRLLLESDGQDVATWEDEIVNSIRLIGDDSVDFQSNWAWCEDILREANNGKL
jgi:Tat protein secretion system quality control protein TatD with DNase activity